jgi:hypothetical protein
MSAQRLANRRLYRQKPRLFELMNMARSAELIALSPPGAVNGKIDHPINSPDTPWLSSPWSRKLLVDHADEVLQRLST